jgi:hypothetical protein
MPGFPGSPSILKGAFLCYGGTSASPDIIVFPFNPETLSRTIQPAPQAPDSGEPSDATGSPQETIVFTLTLDATDALEQSDQQAATMGVYPVLTAIELLMYPQARDLNVVTLFVWGPYRVVPVRIVGLNISESLFDPNLSPIMATVQVTLVVTPPGDAAGLGYLLQHIATLNTLAALGYSASVSGTGVELPLPVTAPPSSGTGTTFPGI